MKQRTQSYQFQGTVTALSSIAHNGGESFGVTSLFRREKFVQPDGSVQSVPILSGNAMRGLLRDRGMEFMMRELDIGKNRPLSLEAFYFLFSGGALSSTGKRGIDIDYARRIKELIPLIGVFGSATGNTMIEGKAKIGKMILMCAETQHILPESIRNPHALSFWEYLQEEMSVRTDDAKKERYQPLLTGETQAQLTMQSLADTKRSKEGKPQDDTGEHQQMRYFVETIAAGASFYWKIVLDEVTDLEFEAFVSTLIEFSRKPYVGGKSGTGLGEVAVSFDKWTTIDPRLTAQATDVALPLGQQYINHLHTHKSDIDAVLGTIV